jgi:DNA-binding SARP family transcriptional activator
MVLEFRLLGPVEVRRDGLALELGSAKSRALLAFLLLSPNRPVSTERLIEALWGGAPPQSARQALQNRVSAVRRALGLDQGALVTRERGYLVRVDPEAIDAHRFVGLADRGRAALAAGDPVPAAVLLRQALALWRGPAVADGFDAGAPWPAVGWLEERRLAAIEDRIEADLARGQHRELAGELRALIATHPLRERLRGQLMLALYRSGRQAEALAAYRDGRAAFVAELGTEPGVELRRLEQAILAQDSSLELARAGETTAPDGPDRTRGPATASPGSERKLVTALLADIDEPAGPGGERGRPVPLLVVATARPELLERRPGLGAEEALLRLGPLPDGDTTRLLELLLTGQGLGGTVDEAGTTGASRRHGRSRIACGAVGADLLDRVGGSPLFAEEYARMLRDRGQAAGAAAPPLPERVHAIAARLDALPPAEKSVLQDAAVLGQVSRADALAAVGGHDHDRLAACCGGWRPTSSCSPRPAIAASTPSVTW